MHKVSFVVALTFLLACSSNDASSPSPVEGVDASADGGDERTDSGIADASAPIDSPDAESDASSPSSSCEQAKGGLASTADPQAPSLDASKSMLQRVASNDNFCTQQKAKNPDFGGFGYLLNIAYSDAEGDAPNLSKLTETPGLVRFGSSPDAEISKRYDPQHGWSTQGSGMQGTLVLQLCLDRVYPAGTLTIAVDVADAAGHRSSAICITEPSGG